MAEICSSSLGEAWLRVVDLATREPRRELSPAVVVLERMQDCAACEDRELRAALDLALELEGHATVETVANTIFPYSLWNPSRPRGDLYQRYFKILPTLRHSNRLGLYFERLISYPGKRGEVGKNQLDHIVETFRKGNHRRSALQAGIFSPSADLNNARQRGFPCLQQVAFAANQDRRGLAVTGFYAVQYLFERAYGNYLGLARLGEFMAHEMDLTLERVVCFSAVAKLEVPLGQVEPILNRFLQA